MRCCVMLTRWAIKASSSVFLRSAAIAVIAAAVMFGVWSNVLQRTPAQDEPAAPGTFRSYAQGARKRGQTSTTVRPLIDEYDDSQSLNEVLAERSVFLVVLSRLAARTDVLPADMQTWHIFTVEQSLSQRPQDAGAHCAGFAHVATAPNEVAIAFAGGTTTIDGVSVTMDPEPSYPLHVGERYLVFGDLCFGTRTFLLSHGLPDLFVVSKSGALSSRYGSGRFVGEVLALRTVEGLKTRLATFNQ